MIAISGVSHAHVSITTYNGTHVLAMVRLPREAMLGDTGIYFPPEISQELPELGVVDAAGPVRVRPTEDQLENVLGHGDRRPRSRRGVNAAADTATADTSAATPDYAATRCFPTLALICCRSRCCRCCCWSPCDLLVLLTGRRSTEGKKRARARARRRDGGRGVVFMATRDGRNRAKSCHRH